MGIATPATANNISEFSEITIPQDTDILLARRPSTGAAGKLQLSVLKTFVGWDLETVVLATSTQDIIDKDKIIVFAYQGNDFPLLDLSNGGSNVGTRVFVHNAVGAGVVLKILLGYRTEGGGDWYIGINPGCSIMLTINNEGLCVPPPPFNGIHAYSSIVQATGLSNDQGPAELLDATNQEVPISSGVFPINYMVASEAAVVRTSTAYGKMHIINAPVNGVYRLHVSAKCSGAATGSFQVCYNNVPIITVNLTQTNVLRHWAFQLHTAIHGAVSVKGGDEISITGKATSGSITIQGVRLMAQRITPLELG